MPYQDIEEVSTSELPRPPSGLERILRKLFVEDWSLKLLALGITLALWFVVTGQNTPVTTRANVQLKFIRPNTLEISNDPPKNVDVLLSGSKHKLDMLDQPALVATVDVSDQRPGERVLRLAERAHLDLPQGVKIEAFQPSAISIRLEPSVDRQLEIEAKLDGEPAEGYEVYAVRLNRSAVGVHGPASLVAALQKAHTETISIVGRKESFTASNIAIDISDPKVDLLDPVVNVEIEIGERRVEKTFSDIPVSTNSTIKLQQRTAAVTVIGPAGLIANLRAEDVKIVLDSAGNALEPRLELAPAFQGRVILKSVKPDKFVVSK